MEFWPIALALALFAIFLLSRTIRVVPQQMVFIVERLGKFDRIISAGPHILIPFVDQVTYRHSLKEIVLDTPEQLCITKDNVQIHVDGDGELS